MVLYKLQTISYMNGLGSKFVHLIFSIWRLFLYVLSKHKVFDVNYTIDYSVHESCSIHFQYLF